MFDIQINISGREENEKDQAGRQYSGRRSDGYLTHTSGRPSRRDTHSNSPADTHPLQSSSTRDANQYGRTFLNGQRELERARERSLPGRSGYEHSGGQSRYGPSGRPATRSGQSEYERGARNARYRENEDGYTASERETSSVRRNWKHGERQRHQPYQRSPPKRYRRTHSDDEK